jgi:hypothetical protein
VVRAVQTEFLFLKTKYLSVDLTLQRILLQLSDCVFYFSAGMRDDDGAHRIAAPMDFTGALRHELRGSGFSLSLLR